VTGPSSTPAPVDHRPRLNYHGDVSAAVGQLMGPNLNGELLVLDSTEYDPVTDTTVARFRYARVEDLASPGGTP